MYQLRPYQQRGVDDIRASYAAGHRAPLYVLPTGGGKTVAFNYIAANATARGNRVLILVHRVELLRQTAAKLREIGIQPGLVNPKYSPNPAAKVQVASVQTLVRRLDKVPWDADLIIIDEAHHATASTWRKILEHFPRARVLGVTATPCRSDGSGLGANAGGIFDDLVLGPQIPELIEGGYLARPKIYAPAGRIDLTGVRTRMGDYAKGELAAAMDKPSITGDAVNHYRKLAGGKPAVAFCVNVAHAEHVAAEFRAAGYRAASVDGSTDDATREARIAGLGTGAVQVLTSCDLIGEGVDIPAIEVAILLRPTQSTGLFLQQVGRALRTAPGKDHAVILDHVGNCLTHGLPDEPREWTLDGDVNAKKKKGEEPTIRVKQCEQCFAVHKPAPRCPYCGFVYQVEQAPPEVVPGELQEISEEQRIAMRRARMKEQARAETYEDLLAIARKRGYNPGWARHVWNARQEKQAS